MSFWPLSLVVELDEGMDGGGEAVAEGTSPRLPTLHRAAMPLPVAAPQGAFFFLAGKWHWGLCRSPQGRGGSRASGFTPAPGYFFGEMVINPFRALPGRATLPSAQIPPVTHARPSLSCQVLHCQRPAAPPAAIFPPGLCPGTRGRRQDDGATCGAPPPRLPPPAEGLASAPGDWAPGAEEKGVSGRDGCPPPSVPPGAVW